MDCVESNADRSINQDVYAAALESLIGEIIKDCDPLRHVSVIISMGVRSDMSKSQSLYNPSNYLKRILVQYVLQFQRTLPGRSRRDRGKTEMPACSCTTITTRQSISCKGFVPQET
jgi:hypothetical protein